MNALVYVDIDQGIHKGKMKVAQNEKRKKLLGFSFYINIVNFEAYLWNLQHKSFNLEVCKIIAKSVDIFTILFRIILRAYEPVFQHEGILPK